MAENTGSDTGVKVQKQVDHFQTTLNETKKQNVNTDDGGIPEHNIIYFKKMFANNLSESTSNRVKFLNIKKEIMHLIVDFLYSSDSELPTNCDIVIDLFQAAHILEIEALVEKCSVHLVNNIDLSNWFKVWKLVDAYECDEIIGKIVGFAVNNLESIMITPEFLELDFQELLKVIQELNEQRIKCTDPIMKGILDWAKEYKERENSLAKLLTSFSEIDLSNDFIESLLVKEPIIENNSEVLCMFLKLQLRKSKNKSNSESDKTTRGKAFAKSCVDGKEDIEVGPRKGIVSLQMPFFDDYGLDDCGFGDYGDYCNEDPDFLDYGVEDYGFDEEPDFDYYGVEDYGFDEF